VHFVSRLRPIPVLALALLVACAGQPGSSPSASTVPSVEATPTSSLEPTDGPTPSASATPQALGFDYTDILRIEVDNLAVRTAPFTSSPLATAWRNGEMIGEARLGAGDYVSVELGPLQIGDTTWYRVWPAENAELNFSTIDWDTKGDGPNPVEPGWMATDVGDETYVSLFRPADVTPTVEGLPLLLSGTGNVESEPFEGFDLYLLDWAYVIDGQDAPCDFAVELTSADDGDSVDVVASSTIGAFEEGANPIGAGDRNPIIGEEIAPLVLKVRSDCEWSLRFDARPHD
jgi:hypothetical protein